MTFFYDLNKKMAELAKPKAQLNEGAVAERATGDYSAKKARAGKDIGKPGKNFEKIAKSAGERYGSKDRGEKVAGAVLAKLRAKEDVEEGIGDVVKKVGGAVKNVAGKAIEKLGHGSDEQMIRDLQKKAGVPQTGQKPGHDKPMSEEGGIPMTPKQKSFAKLAPPEDKITFADKIAGAKKEVDEMLGDVAAEAMKNALVGGQKKLDKNKNGRLDAQDFEMLRKGAGKSEEMDEGWDDMLKDVEKRRSKMKTGEKVQGHKGEIEKTDKGIKHTRRYDDKTGETDTGDDDTPKGEKRRGRPKGTGKAMGAKGPSGKSKLMTKETDHDSNELKHAMAVLKKAGYKISKNKEELDEKAVSKAQQRFMGMAHAMQKGEKIPGASKELKKVAKTMKKGDVEDYAATKHKGLPEKKKKKEDVEETTTSGSVATATEAPKSKGKGGFTFGKGIYDSMNRDLENMISESMNVSVNMTMDDQGQPHKNITVSAEGEAAEQLAQLLNLAGLQGAAHDDHSCPTCNQAPCGCSEMVDENAPDWPTNTEVGGEDDPHLHMYAGGLNKPKETGQTTVPVVNRDPRRGSFGPAESPADVKESKDLGMKLYHELKSFKG